MSSPTYTVDRHDDGFSECPTSHLAQVSELSHVELREWAAVPLDGADAEGVERIIWARCWAEPDLARGRCAEALAQTGHKNANKGTNYAYRDVPDLIRGAYRVVKAAACPEEAVAAAWLRALAALEGIDLEVRE